MKSADLSMVSRDDLHFEPLEITAILRTAVISDSWLPLDGLLLYQQTREALGSQEASFSGTSGLAQPKGQAMLGGKLPIKTVHGREWYYRCSWAEWSPHADGQDHWNKRYDNALSDYVSFGQRRGTVNNLAGAYKAYHQPLYYRSALWVRWCCVGDKTAIEQLLSTLTHLGKKPAQGWGRVARWEILSVSEDCSIWKDGKLMRGLPPSDVPEGYQGDLALYGIRPSYWDRRNQTMLVMP
jgi:CRISPR type IV-associated protein Csf3